MEKVLVINPNSSEAVTRGIDEACAPHAGRILLDDGALVHERHPVCGVAG